MTRAKICLRVTRAIIRIMSKDAKNEILQTWLPKIKEKKGAAQMTQSIIKGSVTAAIIKISREKKANTDLYNQKSPDVSKRQNHKKETKAMATQITRAKKRKRVTRAIIRVMSKK